MGEATQGRRQHQLAAFNIARGRGIVTEPVMEGFVERLDEINEIADRSPGFVWRLQASDGNATSIRPYEDDRMLINLSVWDSVETLHAFVYRSAHVELIRDRHDWFTDPPSVQVVLWWVPAGHRPTVEDGMGRLERLEREGPGEEAFTFGTVFPATWCG